ncbi:MAG: flagellar basal body rod protein FlgB [Bdellovibrionales bacterium]
MSLTDGGVMSLLSDKMTYLGQKLSVYGQNVANADTAGYKAKDLKPFVPFSQALNEASRGMKVTDDKHIVPASMAGANAGTKKARSFETVPSGNSVDLEQQMMQVSSTTIDYQATVSIYQKMLSMMKLAVGK